VDLGPVSRQRPLSDLTDPCSDSRTSSPASGPTSPPPTSDPAQPTPLNGYACQRSTRRRRPGVSSAPSSHHAWPPPPSPTRLADLDAATTTILNTAVHFVTGSHG
jgi:hypothetical protein